MTVGVLMFGFVAYQLWGTGIEFRQHQSDLAHQFTARQAALATSSTAPSAPTSAPTTRPTTTGPTTTPATTTLAGPTPPTTITPAASTAWPAIQLGDVIAVIEIPKIHKNVYVVAGIRKDDLKKGIGHYPDTPLPGQLGNTAFAGHRTTFGAPLFDIDQLAAGDQIIVTTITNQRYVYRMVGEAQIVSPTDYAAIRDSDPTKATLTLTSCHPRYSARKRIVVHADLDATLSGPVAAATPYYGQTASTATTAPGDGTAESTDEATLTDAGPTPDVAIGALPEGAEGLSRGWFDDGTAWWQVGLWGLALALVALGSWFVGRRTRRWWLGPVVAVIPFLVVLYFFYQNVNRLLPPDL
jgi:sortase A